ncbi:CMRF35-like molecule 3 isoform X3 [Takifugu rubripes]|uniref:CMRF35-like molecule 3 isoform X3 n=2 Tax=Takifugu rubripes TaxID=31033 RepID=UPI0005D2663C|nr:CMRF35-like molecule 3 isoform X3 [Takifugu rubripes]|eukprot:XP_011600983.1 PREDICTED: CMRF35-like molecule 3 isoform X2 [Takifugu rubripes]
MRISDFFCGPVLCVFWLPAGTDPARLSAPEEVTAALGGSLTVSCRYAHTYRDHTKYWCKGKTYELCHIVVKTPRNRPSSRAFIEDYKQKGFFTVTMTSLEERDEDQYCDNEEHKHTNSVSTGDTMLVGSSTLDPLYFTVVLFDIDTHL